MLRVSRVSVIELLHLKPAIDIISCPFLPTRLGNLSSQIKTYHTLNIKAMSMKKEGHQ